MYVEADGETYLHYGRWVAWRDEYHRNNPPGRGHFRVDLELQQCEVSRPETFRPMPVFWHACDEWTVASQVHKVTHPEGGPSCRFLAEASHQKGERLILYSTFCSIWPEPWGRNKPEVYAFFRGHFWKVTWRQFLAGWKGNIKYPLTIRAYKHQSLSPRQADIHHWGDDDYLPPTFRDEAPDEAGDFLAAIYDRPGDAAKWLVLSDWLEERGDPLYEFVRRYAPAAVWSLSDVLAHRPLNYRTLTLVAAQYLPQLSVYHPENPANISIMSPPMSNPDQSLLAGWNSMWSRYVPTRTFGLHERAV